MWLRRAAGSRSAAHWRPARRKNQLVRLIFFLCYLFGSLAAAAAAAAACKPRHPMNRAPRPPGGAAERLWPNKRRHNHLAEADEANTRRPATIRTASRAEPSRATWPKTRSARHKSKGLRKSRSGSRRCRAELSRVSRAGGSFSTALAACIPTQTDDTRRAARGAGQRKRVAKFEVREREALIGLAAASSRRRRRRLGQ